MKKQVLKVVKIGGKLIEDETRFQQFLTDFAKLQGPKMLVHGGGNLATDIALKLGHETKMIDGRRITDEAALKVIIMTYAGLINKTIVAKLQAFNCDAIGLCGADGQSIISRKRAVKEVDYGFVGDIEAINTGFISTFLEQGITPVFSAISCTKQGELLNTNGDSVAAEIAKAFSKTYETQLYYCFEKNGVLADTHDDASVIETMNKEQYRQLLQDKVISEGMLPKLHNCFEALENGVTSVILGNADLFQEESTYTRIIPS